jgi:hypothetical protein
VSGLEPGDPVDRGGEQHPVAQLGGPEAEPGGEVGSTGAGRAERDDVQRFGGERTGGQVGDGAALKAGWWSRLKSLERFAGREPGGTSVGA